LHNGGSSSDQYFDVMAGLNVYAIPFMSLSRDWMCTTTNFVVLY